MLLVFMIFLAQYQNNGVIVTEVGWSKRNNMGLTFAIGTTFVWLLYMFF
jgi:hypothetical protein